MTRQDTAGLKRDVVIDAHRYPLVYDKNRGFAWWHEDDEAITEGVPQQVARAIWESGFASGMGETQRFDPNTDGYAFSVGWDAVKPGRIKPSGRRATISTGSLADKKTDGWIRSATAGGNAVYSVFSFAKSTTVGTTSQTGISHGLSSVAPRAFIFWTAGQTVSGTVGAGPTFEHSFMGFTDGTTSRAAAWIVSDNQPAAVASRVYNNSAIYTHGGSIGQVANIGASTFDINWTSNDANAIIIHGIAFGGADISAKVVEWAQPTSTGNKSVTGVGFKPVFVAHLGNYMTAAGTGLDGAAMHFGAMDNAGNQWAIANLSVNAADPTQTERYQVTNQTIVITDGAGGQAVAANYVSMDDDGFTVNFTDCDVATLQASLCIKGIQASVGAVLKTASTANQAAVSLPFTSTAFMVASTFQGASSTVNAHSAFGFGAASATNQVEASAYYDEDNVGTTDCYGLDDTTLAFEIIDATGAEVDTATCGNVDMGTAGWLTWAAPTADASQLCYIGFAALAPITSSPFVYISNGQRVRKLSVSGTTITVEATKDHGSNAQCGSNALFESATYLALGGTPNAQKLTTVAASGGTDTWASVTVPALAVARQQDGGTAKLLRGHTVNNVMLSPDGSTWTASSYEIGDNTSPITNMADTGTSVYVAKTDGLYRFVSEGVSQQIIESQPDSENGCGLLAIEGTDAVLYNDLAGLWLFDGANLPTLIGPDASDLNQLITNITHEPRGGRHLETAKVGKWYFSVYRVTDSTTKTYILAGYRLGQRWIWHTVWRYDGVVRGVVPDTSARLWHAFVSDGLLGYHQLDVDGCPDPGRNSIGHGAASTTYPFYLPEIMFPAKAYLHSMEVLLVNAGSTVPVQLQYQVDGGAVTNLGSTLTTSGIQRSFKGTTAVGGYRWRPIISVTTTGGYDNTTTSPLEIRAVRATFWTRPQKSNVIHFIIDAGKALSPDEVKPPDDALTMWTNLHNLARGDGSGPAVACTDPDGATIYINPWRVADTALREVEGELHWTIEGWAQEWTTASQ